MEISFSLDKADLVAFEKEQVKRRGGLPGGPIYLVLLLVIACVVHGIQEGFELNHLLAIAAILLIYVGYLWLRAHQLKTLKASPQKLYLKLTPEELIQSNDLTKNATRWEAVEKVSIRRDHGFIYFSGGSALIVPKRAFADESAFEQFMQTAKSYRESAKQNLAPKAN